MFIRLVAILILLVPTSKEYAVQKNERCIVKMPDKCYKLNKDSIQYYPLNEVMSAIAYHECYNLTQTERWLVMEAFMNRVEDNFNNNGHCVEEQLLAPKQFTGLWKYNSQQFQFNTNDTLSIQNLEMANAIIAGYRISTQRIYYWAGTTDHSCAHGRFVKRHKINTSNKIKHWFR